MLRGDYAAALRILKPLAENAREPDPLAQFFLATMYERGNGVAVDYVHACGLYRRAAATSSPIGPQATALAEGLASQSPRTRELCVAATTDTWHEPPTARFTLGPDQWVKIDETGMTVGYNGKQKRALISFGGVDLQYLPFRYTRVMVTHPEAVERHFVDVFMWMRLRDRSPTQWILPWFVYEIVGADVRLVPDQRPVASVVADRPPPSGTPEQFGLIRVNATGEAERVFFGIDPRTAVIPITWVP